MRNDRLGEVGAGVAAAPLPDVLEDLARRLRTLAPDHRNPEAFHERKSDLVDALRRLAARERGA